MLSLNITHTTAFGQHIVSSYSNTDLFNEKIGMPNLGGGGGEEKGAV